MTEARRREQSAGSAVRPTEYGLSWLAGQRLPFPAGLTGITAGLRA